MNSCEEGQFRTIEELLTHNRVFGKAMCGQRGMSVKNEPPSPSHPEKIKPITNQLTCSILERKIHRSDYRLVEPSRQREQREGGRSPSRHLYTAYVELGVTCYLVGACAKTREEIRITSCCYKSINNQIINHR